MKRMATRCAIAATLVLGCLVAGCAHLGAGDGPVGATDAAEVAEEAGAPVWLEIDGRPFTEQDVDDWIRAECFAREVGNRSPSEAYQVRADSIEQIIDYEVVKAEAERRGVSTVLMISDEVEAMGPVTPAQIAVFYEDNRERLGAVPLEEAEDDIRLYLERQRPAELRARLRERADVRVLLEPPRTQVDASGPALGPEDAPVTLVEFSDYQCPFCRRAEPTLQELAARYPDQLRIVFRHFPLASIHPLARGAAEAAVCAEAQGRFWDYHEQLWSQGRALARADLRAGAQRVGLDMAAFDVCLDAPQTAQRVQEDVSAARAAGVRSTPSFFVNGIALQGARPLEDFVRVIERELARP